MDTVTPQNTIWITGASSGIGFSLVEQYIAQGYRVFASARRAGRLADILAQTPALTFIPFDVTKEDEIDLVRQTLLTHTDHLDCAILNAGTCEYLDIHQPDWRMMQRVMSVNYFGMVNSVEVCLPLLKKATQPHLVGVGSQAVQAAFTQAEAYGASKAAVRYFLSSLRIDLRPFNIDVTCILPGFVDTPLTQKNTFAMPFLMSCDNAAERIVAAIARRPYEYAFPKRLSAMLWLARQFPKRWAALTEPKQKEC